MKVNIENCTSIVAPELIRLLGGSPADLHTFCIRSVDGSTFLIRAFAKIEGLSRDEVITRNLFKDRRLEVSFQSDSVLACRYDDGNAVAISINPLLRYLWLSKVINEAPPRQFQAHGDLCFQDEDGHQIFAAVSITEATFDSASNEFAIVAGRFHVNPALIPDAWRGNVANTVAPE